MNLDISHYFCHPFVIVMNNGDYITGKIKKMQFSLVTFKTDAMGTLSIKWTKIRHLISKHTFEVYLNDGRLIYGSLDSTDVEGETFIKNIQNCYRIYHNDVVEIIPIKNTFWDRLPGSISLGFNYTKGTKTGQTNLAGKIAFRLKIWY